MSQETTEVQTIERPMTFDELVQTNLTLTKRLAIVEKRLNETNQAIVEVAHLMKTIEKVAVKNVFNAISSIFHGVAHQFDAESEQLLPTSLVNGKDGGDGKNGEVDTEEVFTLVEIDPADHVNHIVLKFGEQGYEVYRSTEPDTKIEGPHAATIIDNLGDLHMHVGEVKYLMFKKV